ncbi:lipid A deacylase LpxR family protein [Pedobacter cryotolerans]|uniref:Lipid A deacylase LpxR family protein n=1 Tax=Pedobacter cryotolerans TaxID=2571270 RepID=A0A4V5NXK8_9SPHI|nr:lipid A deacylase LpxR family protein [Pedobacter cryotolerans]TKB99815.1 lipid A deacylase LpxR family protein [Pedobacter cryotolerans]
MKLKIGLLAIVMLLSSSLFAQSYKNEFGFKSDNDAYLFYGQDRYYTNGLFIYFRHATDQQKLGGNLEKLTYEITAGQKMFNAISGNVPDPAKQDRPFAGYLYAGGNVNLFYKSEKILKVGLEAGTVGPNSLAEDGQKLLHDLVGFYEIDGWQYQISNEFAVNLSTQYTQLLHRSAKKDVDFSFEGYANVGTTFSGAGAGVLFRAGKINQLFNSGYTNSVISNNAKTEKLVKRETFFYAKPQLNFVAYDATIQGSMFNNDSPITFGRKPLVFAQQLGVNYSTPRFTLDFGLIFKSKEVKSSAKANKYGMISMFYRFGKSGS